MGNSNSRTSSPPPRRQRNRSSFLSRPASLFLPRDTQTEEVRQISRSGLPPLGTLRVTNPDPPDPDDEGHSTTVAEAPQMRRRSRLTRARTTFTASLPGILRGRSEWFAGEEGARDVESPSNMRRLLRSFRRHTTAEIDVHHFTFLPTISPPTLNPRFEQPLDDTANVTHPEHLLQDYRPRSTSSLSDPLSLLRPDRGIRSMSSSRRPRRSPVRRGEDQAAMLSRLLSVAAAATAATLMGDDQRAVNEARSVATGDGDDGTFDSFLQALQNGRIASALRGAGRNGEDADEDGVPAPLNFFRMFRFNNANQSRSTGFRPDTAQSGGTNGEGSSETQDEQSGDGRMVPIIIVGIRSIPPNNAAGGSSDAENMIPPFLEALSNFAPPPTSGDTTNDRTLRRPQNGTRFSHRRRASMGGLNRLPSAASQQTARTEDRPRSTTSDFFSSPHPPPTTPASPGLSAMSSGANTPTRRPSSSSAGVNFIPSRRNSFARRTTNTPLETTAEEPAPTTRGPRQRRLSESDFSRYGAGASRRNGMVGVEPENAPAEGSRSWIIYVLGGSYPEDHPILTTPSLFTDSPTYEDMMLLSQLLGPAKPPVATDEDVAEAPGLFNVQATPDGLVAYAAELDLPPIALAAGERCLVCLCDFEQGEQLRRLMNCTHMFHRECIDEWLTTGRNSCPLCREQGVTEKGKESDQSTTPVEERPDTPTPMDVT